MMTVTTQDGKLTFNPETGRWEDEDGNIGWEHKRVCSQCGKPRLDLNGVSDCDFCLQALTSCDFIDNACCGHGVDKNAYISLKDGRRFILDTASKEVVNKLNEQQDTIITLRRRLEKINGGYGHLTHRNGLTANEWVIERQEKELKKKNEQISDWIEQHSKDIVKIGEQQSTIQSLKEENEGLQQFINKGRRLSVKELINNANENELLKKKIRGLEKENENLRKENKDLNDIEWEKFKKKYYLE